MTSKAFSHLEDLRRAYDRGASQRNALEDLQWRPAVLEAWLRELPSAPRLLELGPGTGQLALYAQQLGARVHVIDLSAQNVEYCRQRGLSAQVGDLRELVRSDELGLFDGVYAINVLLHVPRAEHAAVMAAVRARLLPGGSALIVSWGGLDREGIWDGDSFDPPRYFSQYGEAAFQALEFDGFEVVRARGRDGSGSGWSVPAAARVAPHAVRLTRWTQATMRETACFSWSAPAGPRRTIR